MRILDAIFTNGNRCACSDLSTHNRVLVGAERAFANCFLDYVSGLFLSYCFSSDLLHYVEECQKVIRRMTASFCINLLVYGSCYALFHILHVIFNFLIIFYRRSDFYDDDVFINPDGAELPDEVHTGVDNTHMVANPHAMRSRDNIYEYRDSPSSKTLASKIHTDTTSIRSPSSLAMTQKSGSQSSLKSTMSLKETTGGTLTSCSSSARPSRTNGLHNGSAATIQTPKVFEEKRLITRELTKPEPISSTPLVTTSTAKISITSEPISLKPTSNIIATSTSPNLTGTVSSRSTTPVPSARTHTHTTTATVTSAPQVQRPVLPTSSAQAQSRAQARTQVIEGVPQTSV